MSKVTILSLVSDYKEEGYEWRYPNVLDKTEIVPRKLVEMIIEKCNDVATKCFNPADSEKVDGIIEYAESLLKQFEEEDE